MNWVFGVTMAVLLIGLIAGFSKGAVRIAVSLLAALVTLVLVTVATPYVADAITAYTPIDDMIRDEVESTIESSIRAQIEGATDDAEDTGDTDAGISEEYEDAATDAIANMEVPRDTQMLALENADLPEIFKTLLEENNNDVTYQELGVESFAQYVGAFLANIVIRVLAFLATFLIVILLLRAVVFGLDVVSALPGLGVLNHLLGGLLGLALALIVVWLLYLLVTVLYTTQVGRMIYDRIHDNYILLMLYDNNPIMKLALKG